jgi:hypothetical protein
LTGGTFFRYSHGDVLRRHHQLYLYRHDRPDEAGGLLRVASDRHEFSILVTATAREGVAVFVFHS